MKNFAIFSKTFSKYVKTYKNQQYQQWKWYTYTQWADQAFRPFIMLQIIYTVIKLSIIANDLFLWITFGIQTFLTITLFAILPRAINSQSSFLQLIPLLQQQCICWVCYINKNEDYLILYTTLCIIFQSMYSSILWKTVTALIFVGETLAFVEMPSYEGLYLSFALIVIQIFKKEFQQLQHFLNIQSLFMIIDSIPQALCIVHKDKNWLLYSNKVFDNLAKKLESINQLDTDQSPEKNSSSHSQRNQLSFLQNLQLDEFNDQGLQLFEFGEDDLQIEEQCKIKNVFYSKQQSQMNSQKTLNFEFPIQPHNYQHQQKFFQAFKFKEEEEIIKKAYTSDVTMKIEYQTQQWNCQSAGKKNFRKNTGKDFRGKLGQFTPSRKVSADQLLSQSRDYRSSGQKQSLFDQEFPVSKPKSTINHKMKFLIHVMENFRIFHNEDDLQIYFINEVNQVLLQAKLKKLESIKKNILRSISHELLTNLNAVFGYIKQCQDKVLKQESCKEQLEQALRYTKLQQYKIYDFFDYRDILEDKFIMKQDKFEINNVIWECVNLLRDQIDRKSLTIEVDLPEISYIMKGDRQRLCQVLLNLIGNAIRFTFKGGISIIVKKAEYIESMQGVEGSSENHLEVQSNVICIWVNDTGIGMNEEELSTLIKKLHVADEDEKISKQSVGIGLGLSVCKQIIKQLAYQEQNFLNVVSEKDQGSRFSFFLQYDDEKPTYQAFLQKSNNLSVPFVDAASTQQVRVMNYNKCNNLYIGDKIVQSELKIQLNKDKCICQTILIVDDEQFNIEILAHMVKQLGFSVDFAFNGKQALEKLQHTLQRKCLAPSCIGYNCILMDINMPIMNGWEAVQRIRQMENELHFTKTIPVVAVTAFCSIQDQQKSINEGFNSVIIKPVNKERLLETFTQLNI